jgi:hypothetical protein
MKLQLDGGGPLWDDRKRSAIRMMNLYKGGNPMKSIRNTWTIKPVTKVKESKKIYNRKRDKRRETDKD